MLNTTYSDISLVSPAHTPHRAATSNVDEVSATRLTDLQEASSAQNGGDTSQSPPAFSLRETPTKKDAKLQSGNAPPKIEMCQPKHSALLTLFMAVPGLAEAFVSSSAADDGAGLVNSLKLLAAAVHGGKKVEPRELYAASAALFVESGAPTMAAYIARLASAFAEGEKSSDTGKTYESAEDGFKEHHAGLRASVVDKFFAFVLSAVGSCPVCAKQFHRFKTCRALSLPHSNVGSASGADPAAELRDCMAAYMTKPDPEGFLDNFGQCATCGAEIRTLSRQMRSYPAFLCVELVGDASSTTAADPVPFAYITACPEHVHGQDLSPRKYQKDGVYNFFGALYREDGVDYAKVRSARL